MQAKQKEAEELGNKVRQSSGVSVSPGVGHCFCCDSLGVRWTASNAWCHPWCFAVSRRSRGLVFYKHAKQIMEQQRELQAKTAEAARAAAAGALTGAGAS